MIQRFALVNLLALAIAACSTPVSPPAERTFRMGMTPWPYAFTDVALESTYDVLEAETDIVAHHLDNGVPWVELAAGNPFHPNVMVDLNDRAARLPHKKRFVSISPLDGSRTALSGYWQSETSMALPSPWDSYDFSDTAVRDAYIDFCNDIIARLDPDYFAYAIEANSHEWEDAAFAHFKDFAQEVYSSLKTSHPTLPIFLTVVAADGSDADSQRKRALAAELLPYSDWVAISTYPFMETGSGDPSLLPSDWFSGMAALAPSKPFAVAETGINAETLELPSYVLSIPGSEAWQDEYMALLLLNAQQLRAEFVIWFVPRDYDDGWAELQAGGADELLKLWKDNGLYTGSGTVRPALKRWRAWLAQPVE